jgi:hypothetical protein
MRRRAKPRNKSCTRIELLELSKTLGASGYLELLKYWEDKLNQDDRERIQKTVTQNSLALELSLQANEEGLTELVFQGEIESFQQLAKYARWELRHSEHHFTRKLAIRFADSGDLGVIDELIRVAGNASEHRFVRCEALRKLQSSETNNAELVTLLNDLMAQEDAPLCLRSPRAKNSSGAWRVVDSARYVAIGL